MVHGDAGRRTTGAPAVGVRGLPELGELQALEGQLAELLAEDGVVDLAAAMEPGSTAGVLIWENLGGLRSQPQPDDRVAS
jgi:hypothetical protein